MKTNRIVTAVALACTTGLLTAGANAAGPGDWAGGYVGGNVGYGQDSGVVVDFIPNNPSDSFDMKGYRVGIYGGYNWAAGPVVAGIEADATYADINGDARCPNPAWTCGATLDQLFTLRGRVGVPVGVVLLYGTLGIASGQVEAFDGPTGGTEYKDRKRNSGWVAGLGGEMAFTRQLSGRFELLYTDLGDNKYTVDPPPGDIVSVETKVTALRAGIGYKF